MVAGVDEGERTATRDARPRPGRRVPLSAALVVNAALELTDGRGLNSWTQRDLARRLGVAPSVLYHHIGSRDQVVRGVVERVITGHPVPSPNLPWQDWFRHALLTHRPLLIRYPGVAKWLLMHGPSFPETAQEFDAGITVLERAGFVRPAMAYTMLYNTAILTISLTDDRLETGDDGPRDHGAMLAAFEPLEQQSRGMAAVVREMVRPLAEDQEAADELHETYYRLVVDSMLAGVDVLRARGEL